MVEEGFVTGKIAGYEALRMQEVPGVGEPGFVVAGLVVQELVSLPESVICKYKGGQNIGRCA